MKEKREFKKKLTHEEIGAEVAKMKDFFEQLNNKDKSYTAELLCYEAIIWGSQNLYEALGILQEVAARYRETWYNIMEEEEKLEVARENTQDFVCKEEIDFGNGKKIEVAQVCQIGFVEYNMNYAGGARFEVFLGGGEHFDICQEVLKGHFESIDSEN